MAYDKNIPDVLQLLRLDLGNVDYTVPSDTTIARYAIDGDYFPRYCIADVADDADTMDIRGAIEETMHAILDYGGTADDLRTAMGLVPGRKSTRTSSSPASASPSTSATASTGSS